MFETENEDLIPRCAPKPSASGITVEGSRPSVPEISIVFTQKESAQSNCSPPAVITSYSVWKNKCLPCVNYPLDDESIYKEMATSTKRSNIFPLPPGTVIVPSLNYTAKQIPLDKTEYSEIPEKSLKYTLEAPYSEQLQNAKFSPKCVLASSYNRNNENSLQQKQPRLLLSTNVEEYVPAVSTGTQTENFCYNDKEPNFGNLATKKDIAEIKSMIVDMERQHRHLVENLQNVLLEKLKLSFDTNKANLRDVGIQYDEELTQANWIQKQLGRYDVIKADLNKKEDYDYKNKSNIQTSNIDSTCPSVMPGVLKNINEQSIVMNELAVKYLNNGKLNDTLQDVIKFTKVKNQYESPLKDIENANPTDLSTASYKYLQKYRLLPEENNNISPHNNLLSLNDKSKQENLLDLEMIRCKPKFM